MKKNASILTLGCRLNQADSALIAGRLERMDIELKPTCAPQFMRIAKEMQ